MKRRLHHAWNAALERTRLPVAVIWALWCSVGLVAGVASGVLWSVALLLACYLAGPNSLIVAAFIGAAFRFRKCSSTQVWLWCDPSVAAQLDLPALRDYLEEEVRRGAETFGVDATYPVRVLIFRTSAEVSWTHPEDVGGFALPDLQLIFTGFDNLEMRDGRSPMLRHELAHVLAAPIGDPRPALKAEGLAVWHEGLYGGWAPHAVVLALIELNGLPDLSELLDDDTFYGRPYIHYPVAGSFTTYLIDRFGWDAYRAYYAKATPEKHTEAFRDAFGADLSALRLEWIQAIADLSGEYTQLQMDRIVWQVRYWLSQASS